MYYVTEVYTEALNPVLQMTEFEDSAEHFTPPDEIISGSKSAGEGLVVFRHN